MRWQIYLTINTIGTDKPIGDGIISDETSMATEQLIFPSLVTNPIYRVQKRMWIGFMKTWISSNKNGSITPINLGDNITSDISSLAGKWLIIQALECRWQIAWILFEPINLLATVLPLIKNIRWCNDGWHCSDRSD